MPYLGKKPEDTFRGLAFKDTFTGDGSTVAFDITNAAPAGGDFDIEVFVENPDTLINKKYENDQWVDAPVIWYATVNSKGKITEIKNTVFPSIVGSNPLIEEDINPESVWDGTSWNVRCRRCSSNFSDELAFCLALVNGFEFVRRK